MLQALFEPVLPPARVTRSRYLVAGLSLMAVKYGVDAILFRIVVGAWWHPLDYLNPIYAQRMAAAPAGSALPKAYVLFLLLWGLLFVWLGIRWSIRRALDAGVSPWWSLFFAVPYFNYVLILALLLHPSQPRDFGEVEPGEDSGAGHRASVTVFSGLIFLALMAVLYGIVIHGTGNYGVAAFISLPLVFGLGAGYVTHTPGHTGRKGAAEVLLLALGTTLVACGGLLLFALEGAVCIVMASPIVFTAVLIGALLGRALPPPWSRGKSAPFCLFLALPLSGWIDVTVTPTPPREVVSAIVVDAPIETVWENVVSFAELPEPEHWLFRTGLAYPVRARIEGHGVGAVRHCEFSTGSFVEPITVWDEPHRLAFDVVAQPVPMQEWSFYDDVRPPHLTTTFQSVRGEFRLTTLSDGRTHLEGSTWYELELGPEIYWRMWADEIIHRIHGRVLRHVKALSEG